MRSDKTQALAGMSTRQKVTAVVVLIVVLVLGWQVVGMFMGDGSAPAPAKPAAMSGKTPVSGKPANGAAPQAAPQSNIPQQAQLMNLQQKSPAEMEILRLQQETQAKYLEALNELQMLKVAREIAETNQAIATAKLATVKAQKNVVTLLAPAPMPTPDMYAKTLGTSATVPSGPQPGGAKPGDVPAIPTEVKYTVISVSQLQYRWNAVIGAQGTLYNVQIGDTLPADGSKVISIDRSGVVIENNGARRKLPMTSAI